MCAIALVCLLFGDLTVIGWLRFFVAFIFGSRFVGAFDGYLVNSV